MGLVLINRKYFLSRSNAEVLINLVNYLNEKEIEEEQLEDKNVLTTIIRDDSNKLQFIRTKSIEVIKEKTANVISQLQVTLDSIEDNLPTPAPELSMSKLVNHISILPNSVTIIKITKPLLITREYLNVKSNAEAIINLQEYFIFEEVEEKYLENKNLRDIIHKDNTFISDEYRDIAGCVC
ncbi:hypothetical protein TKK_0002181 [Trichogramma kaykai]